MGKPATSASLAYSFKRLLDFVLATIGILITAPLWLVLAILIRWDSRGPVMFKAQRVGKHGRPFTMYKFRTMRVDAEKLLAELAHRNLGGPYMIKIPDDPRITRVGKLLRRTGLDELPQLINVLRGEMSLVGPRPQAPNEVALYTHYQRRRLAVLPGITGLWQVTARDNPSFDEWVRLDLAYINSWSLGLDVRIILQTIAQAIHKPDAV